MDLKVGLEINFTLQITVEVGNSRSEPALQPWHVSPTGKDQPEPAVFVLGNLRLVTLLRRLTSKAIVCYLEHINEKDLSISLRKIQEA